jgi:hypothetical protein
MISDDFAIRTPFPFQLIISTGNDAHPTRARAQLEKELLVFS